MYGMLDLVGAMLLRQMLMGTLEDTLISDLRHPTTETMLSLSVMGLSLVKLKW